MTGGTRGGQPAATRNAKARRTVGALLLLLVASAGMAPGPAQADPAPVHAARDTARQAARVPVVSTTMVFVSPLEAYAGYQPATGCRPRPKPGVLMLAEALVARGGAAGPIGRGCTGASVSEHTESRAFDWLLDARSKADRATAEAFLAEIFAPDPWGNQHALARRMGIMYVIWNDRIYSAYHGFAPRRYLSSSCRRKRTCSPTLRHRDHMHVSLIRKAARGNTSWYLEQPPA